MKKFLPKTKYSPKGFTLVELLVVVSIIAILSVVGLTVFTSVQRNARDAKRKADVDAISKALEANYTSGTTNPYPALAATMFAGGDTPKDPQNTGDYVYVTTTLPSTAYTVCAKLEAGNGGNSSNNTGGVLLNGGYYCRKAQQS